MHDRDLRRHAHRPAHVAIKQRINLRDRAVVGWLGGMTAAIVGLVWYLSQCLTKDEISLVSKVASNLVLLSIIVAKVRYAITYGLIVELSGVISAVWVAYLLFTKKYAALIIPPD